MPSVGDGDRDDPDDPEEEYYERYKAKQQDLNESLDWIKKLNIMCEEKVDFDDSEHDLQQLCFSLDQSSFFQHDSKLDIEIKDFDVDTYSGILGDVESGKIKINVVATAMIAKVLVNILEQVNKSLILVASDQGRIKTINVKKFLVAISRMRLVESQIVAAFVSPKTDVWYQEETSESCQLLKSILREVPLKDSNEYRKNFDAFMNMFMSMSASLFMSWEETNIQKKR